ncbi:TolC family protein, partial [Gammaproteobacteria bacterium]|nr:TolC family protein [Gammaproteobacteria bacterium]
GVVLARIDQRTPTNTLAQANADLEVAKVRLSNAKNQFERSKRLHDEGNISDKSFEDAQESFSSARAQLVRAEVFLENARIALDDTSVRSPIAGGKASKVKITQDERKIAKQAAKAMGLNIAGVDLLRSNEGPKVLEVNSSPGLQGIETVNNINVASLIIDYVEKRLGLSKIK